MNFRITIISASLILLFTLSGSAQVLVKTTDVTCNGKRNGKATLLISNAPGPYKIKWSYGNTEFAQYKDKTVAAGLGGGSYKVHITDKNDCMIEKTFVINEPPEITVNITSSTGDFDYCGQKNMPEVTLYATATGGTPPLSCSVNSCLKKVTEPGEYSFTVVDSKGCQQKRSVRVNWIGINCSGDPNEIKGPAGFANPKWVAAKDPMEYTIRFENDPELATAPAQNVLVEYVFDPKVNPFSLRLGNFGFGPYLFSLPFTSTFYQQRIDLQSEIGLFVDVVAGYDVNENKAFWSFQSIDPATGLTPIDPLIGFLPVNDSLTGIGEGFVTFTVNPKSNVVTGDVVSANADIKFDVNEEITTNTWTNKLDAFPPVSIMHPTDTLVENPTFTLSWTAHDDTGGCGIRDYALYYQINGGDFNLQGEGILDTFILFRGLPGNKYGFYIQAIDNVGNVENKMIAERFVRIVASDLIDIKAPLSDPLCLGDTLKIKWRTTNIDSVKISMSIDSGETFFTIAPKKLPGDSSFTLLIVDSLLTNYAQLKFASLEDTVYEEKSAFFPIKPLPQVQIAGDASLCGDQSAYLYASGANLYSWSPGLMFNDSTSANPTAYLDSSAIFYLRGTDVYGCVNRDSVVVNKYSVYLDSVDYALCNEDSVFVGGQYQNTTGYYTDFLASSHGCDSTVITHVVLTGPCPFPSPQVYVDKDATGLNNGTSWVNAFTDLQNAIKAVDYYLNVREIWIAEGNYYTSLSGNRDTSYVLRDSVAIYGGFVGNETIRSQRILNPTHVKLSGDIGILNDSTDNAYHVIKVTSSCVDCILDGLTIRFGEANGSVVPLKIGGGLLVEGKILLDHLVIERNTTVLEGAAIYNSGASAITTVRACLFRLNTSGLARDILNSNGAQLKFEGMNSVQN
ncbi:MAG TPA: hypothetical protein VFG10_13775 [Saprospiraceae bacterium]|nr:hypothetical protein [Saprospiraceae bacterium]